MAIDDNTSYELTGYQVKDLAQKIRAKADSTSLASVATSGLYSDLTGAPTIPTVYNGTLTIQQNGTTLGTFSANQSANETINITGGGGSSITQFYYEGDDNMIYKDVDRTEPATFIDVLTAYNSGAVRIGFETVVMVRPYFAVAAGGDFVRTYEYTEYPAAAWTLTDAYLQPSLTAGTNVQISAQNVISATDTTYSAMTGATASVAGTSGLVPAPAAGDNTKVLTGDGTWKLPGLTILKYGTSTYADALAAYQANNLLYCRTSSNSNPGTGDQLRMAFLAYVNAEGTPTEFEFQYYRSVSSKTVTNQGDETFVYKLNKNTGWSVTKRNNYTRITTDSSLTDSFSSGVLTLSANAMTGATSGTAGTAGYVPAPASGDNTKFLRGDGTWQTVSGGGGATKTFFYTDTLNGLADGTGFALYSDANCTTTISSGDFEAACASGTVEILDVNNCMVYPVFMVSDDDCFYPSGSSPLFCVLMGTQLVYCSYTGSTPAFETSFTINLRKPDESLNYSTSEVNTGHTWIDGSKVYKKTVNFGSLPNATSKTVAHGISNLSRVIKVEGYAYRSGDSVCFPIPYEADGASAIGINTNATNISIATGVDRTNIAECYVTLYYTKSS